MLTHALASVASDAASAAAPAALSIESVLTVLSAIFTTVAALLLTLYRRAERSRDEQIGASIAALAGKVDDLSRTLATQISDVVEQVRHLDSTMQARQGAQMTVNMEFAQRIAVVEAIVSKRERHADGRSQQEGRP